ncbi:ATP-binding protein [Streptomyces sp. DSM 44938]|uniref:ATP-binding protein n=1 Tax=Streptomyces litchfieldiae TaxID=3075543 RepID=A0ABU2MYQ9_9ACTN|nr:ATP-binding protein [Streptomyces sp. DSM 44938]MDT0345938.1 ATP-binding protein [Streptomyces sp. DSM 44938]
MSVLADAGALLVSELVTNSVRHSGSRAVRVTVTRTGRNVVRVAVVDASRTMPERRHPRDDAVSGRGLVIVEALTTRWGTDPLPRGKRVWAELTCEDTR